MEQMDIKLIERYFEGDLDENELATVAKKLQGDPDFAAAFQMEQDIVAGIERAGNQRLRERLDQIHQETREQGAKTRLIRPTRRWVWLAAAAFIGAVILGKLLWDGRGKTAEELYAAYAVYDFDYVEKGGGLAAMADVEKLLKEGEYDEALPKINEWLASRPQDYGLVIWKGIALLETRQYAPAHQQFDSLAGTLAEDEGHWHNALAYLREGNIAESKAALNRVSEHSARYKKAMALKGELEKLKQ